MTVVTLRAIGCRPGCDRPSIEIAHDGVTTGRLHWIERLAGPDMAYGWLYVGLRWTRRRRRGLRADLMRALIEAARLTEDDTLTALATADDDVKRLAAPPRPIPHRPASRPPATGAHAT